MAYLTQDQLQTMGFASLGNQVRISDKASFYNCARISLGDNVRIDDFCVVSAGAGGIEIGSYVHVAVYTSLIGAGKIVIADYANLSSRVSIYSSNDDYTGQTMTNPTVPDQLRGAEDAPVFLGKHVIVGCGSVILPGVTLNDGVAIGALSLVKQSCDAFTIHAGQPAKKIGERSQHLLNLEQQLEASVKN